MALCLIALPVLLILGIFSASHRKLAWEAIDCVIRKSTLRPCRTGLDEKLQSAVVGYVLKRSPEIARAVSKHFTVLSYLFAGLMILSSYYSAVGAYNYYYYGNCNGPESTGFCLLDPVGVNSECSETDIDIPAQTTLPVADGSDPIRGNPSAPLTIIEFGCYTCPATKRAEPIINEVLKKYHGTVNLQFKAFTIPRHNLSMQTALAANCAYEQQQYEEYHRLVFERIESLDYTGLVNLADDLQIDKAQFKLCIDSQKYQDEINADTVMGQQAGVHGTPTFFVNDKIILGPKPLRTFSTVIDAELES